MKWNRKNPSTTATIINPSQPKRIQSIIINPTKQIGDKVAVINITKLVSIELKSLEIRFIILPNYCDFAVY